MTEEDPFDCFGGHDDDDDDDGGGGGDGDNASIEGNANAAYAVIKPSHHKRDPSNGILAFHAGTEQALLNYVKQQTMGIHFTGNDKSIRPINAAAVLNSIDKFSMERHWMMHIGQGKGRIIEEFLKECVRAKIAESKSETRPLSLVEIGTYCGYSSILLAKTLKELPVDCYFSICSVEVVEENVQIAKQMVELAGLRDCINVLLLNPRNSSLEELLTCNMKSNSIDFLFLDHDKSLYLEDLRKLEKSGFIKKGCFVAADNIVFAQIDDYRHYVSEQEKTGTVRTRLASCCLEYCEPDCNGDQKRKNMMKDGIELSVYLNDP